MSLVGLIIGIMLFVVALFLASALPEVLTLSVQSEELLRIAVIMIGTSSMAIGIIR